MNLYFLPKADDEVVAWRIRDSYRLVRLARKFEAMWDALDAGHVPTGAIPLIYPLPGLFSLPFAGRHRIVFAIEPLEPASAARLDIEKIKVVVFSVRGRYWPDL